MARVALTAIVLIGCGRFGFDPRVGALPDGGGDAAVGSDASAGVVLLAHTMVNVEANGLTTSAIDTTGASLIVLAECTWSTGTPTVPTDSENNTWQTGLGSYGADSNPSNIKMFYTYAPTTNAAHTFTDVGNDFLSIGVLAFAGTGTTVTVPDDATGATGATPLTFGPLQPGAAHELVVTFACSGNSVATATAVDAGFTRVDMILNGNSGAPEDMASAWEVATSTAAIDPTWTFTGDMDVCAAGAAFR